MLSNRNLNSTTLLGRKIERNVFPMVFSNLFRYELLNEFVLSGDASE